LQIKQYILQRRIIAARRLMEECPGLKSEVVAEKTGFESYLHFYRAFKRITGLSPGAYQSA
jgi:AraC-like DNA-binding protein